MKHQVAIQEFPVEAIKHGLGIFNNRTEVWWSIWVQHFGLIASKCPENALK